MSYQGSWKIDDAFSFYAQTQSPTTGVAVDADAVPTYRIFKDENGTAILTGSMALLDSADTDGLYSEQITLSAANGFEKGKCYCIRIAATVGGTAGAVVHTLQIEAEVDSNTVSPTVSANLIQWLGAAPAALSSQLVQARVASSAITQDANLVSINGNAQSATDLKDFADTGYDPSTHKVQNVVTTDVASSVTALGTGAISAASVSSGGGNAIADALLKRDWTAVTGEASRSVLNALRFLRNKWSVLAGVLTVKKEDDTTTAWTGAVTSDATAAPIIGNDPT